MKHVTYIVLQWGACKYFFCCVCVKKCIMRYHIRKIFYNHYIFNKILKKNLWDTVKTFFYTFHTRTFFLYFCVVMLLFLLIIYILPAMVYIQKYPPFSLFSSLVSLSPHSTPSYSCRLLILHLFPSDHFLH